MASYRKRSKGWEYRISYKDRQGTYKIKSQGGFKTKAEAVKKSLDAEIKINNNVFEDSSLTLADFYANWVRIYKEPNISAVTLRKYDQTLSNIKKYFGEMKVIDITPNFYQEVLNDFCKKYSQKSADNFHYPIKSAMKIAVREHLVSESFAEYGVIHSQIKKKSDVNKFLQEDEYFKVINESKKKYNIKSYLAIYLIAVTGMRYAECLGLTWKDFKIKDKYLDINKTWNYYLTHQFETTKTPSSIRKVPIDDETVKLLKNYKAQYWQGDPYNRIIGDLSNNAANKVLKELVGRPVHIHSLRHTYASYLIAQGIDLISISKLLGHENLNITLKVYAHQLKELEFTNNQKIRTIFDAVTKI